MTIVRERGSTSTATRSPSTPSTPPAARSRPGGSTRRPSQWAEWVGRFPNREVHVAVEACTGWYFVCRALERAGATAHLAEVSETAARRGPKRRAKTDRADARWLRELLCEGRLPEAWIPPDEICELRTKTRLRKTLVDEATSWRQRIQATLFHYGSPSLPRDCAGDRAREWLACRELPDTARERIEVALRMIEAIDAQLAPVERELRRYARRQPGCRALVRAHFRVGELTAAVIVAELKQQALRPREFALDGAFEPGPRNRILAGRR